MAKNASRVVNVLFNKTLHSGHWSKVKFGTMQDFNGRQSKTLTLVVLTWLCQLQQYFLQRPNNKNGDWSKLGKYCGTTTNPLKNTAPLANVDIDLVEKPFQHTCLYHLQGCVVNGDYLAI